MPRQTRQFMRLAFCIAILFVVTAGVVSFLDFFRHPKYYSIRVGMTAREVHAIVGAGYDAYPARNNGWVHYYFCREGTIIVVFDKDSLAISKKLQRN